MANRTSELTGLVRPEMDGQALKRQAREMESALGSAVTSAANQFVNTLPGASQLRRLTGSVRGRGGGASGGGSASLTGQGVELQAAQLEKLDDIHDELEKIGATGGLGGSGGGGSGGGGSGGLLTGFTIGRFGQGLGSTVLGGLGTAAGVLGGTVGLGAAGGLLAGLGTLEGMDRLIEGGFAQPLDPQTGKPTGSNPFGGLVGEPKTWTDVMETFGLTGIGNELAPETLPEIEVNRPAWVDDLLNWQPEINANVPDTLTETPDSMRDASLERHFREQGFRNRIDRDALRDPTLERATRQSRTNRARGKRPTEFTVDLGGLDISLDPGNLQREFEQAIDRNLSTIVDEVLAEIEGQLSGGLL